MLRAVYLHAYLRIFVGLQRTVYKRKLLDYFANAAVLAVQTSRGTCAGKKLLVCILIWDSQQKHKLIEQKHTKHKTARSVLKLRPLEGTRSSEYVGLHIWGVPEIRGPSLGVLIISIIVYWGRFWGPLFLETAIWSPILWGNVLPPPAAEAGSSWQQLRRLPESASPCPALGMEMAA